MQGHIPFSVQYSVQISLVSLQRDLEVNGCLLTVKRVFFIMFQVRLFAFHSIQRAYFLDLSYFEEENTYLGMETEFIHSFIPNFSSMKLKMIVMVHPGLFTPPMQAEILVALETASPLMGGPLYNGLSH